MESFKSTHRLASGWVTLWVVLLTLIASTAWPATNTISSFPYTASQSGSNYSETLLVASTNLSTSGSALKVTGHDIVIYLINDTITFGTSGGDDYYGIQLDYSSHHIKIIGGMIYHGGEGDGNVCLVLDGTNDALIEGTNMRIAGSNGHCVYSPSLGSPGNYNVEINGGYYRSDVTGYTSRCEYDGAAFLFDGYTTSGDYHYKIHDIKLLTGPAQGIAIYQRSGSNHSPVFIYSCSLQSDARNDYYTSGDVTCHSAANPYQILGAYLPAGTKIYDNVVTSGTNYGGSRGIILETCSGTADEPVEVYNNYLDVHEGINLEESKGLVQVLRIRFGNKYLHIHNNTFIGTGSANHGSSYGREVVVFRMTATDEETDVPDHDIIIENNVFRAVALSSNVSAQAIVFESFPNRGNIFRHNRFESSNTIVSFGETNYGADGIMLWGDTLVRLSPSYDPKTVVVGWENYFTASDDTLRDCVYLDGASEEDIQFGASGSDFRLERTLTPQVMGNNGLPVPQAAVSVVNNYGRTVLNGTTNSSGIVTGAVTYRWEQNPGSDSTNYNDFTVKAKKGSDSTVLSFEVKASSTCPTLVLANTPGEEPPNDIIPPGTISNLNATQGPNHGEISLSWTAPGDDGNTGTADHYVIKYSNSTITESNWSTTTTVPNPPSPSPAGSSENFTIDGLSEGHIYYIAIKAYDEEDNVSGLSNVPQAYATGIMTPTPAGTVVDPENSSVTVSCDQVESYYTLSYQFALDSVVTFPDPRIEVGSVEGSTVLAVFDQLDKSVTYHWRCRAVASNMSDSSAWSDIRTFDFSDNTPPTAPEHVSPSNRDTTTADPIVLVINNAYDADGDPLTYDFWISDNRDFVTVLDSVMNVTERSSQTSAVFSSFTPQDGERYWWRCRANDGMAYSDKTTPTWFVWVSFSAGENYPPSQPTHISPGNGETVVSTPIVLLIENSIDPEGDPILYDFWIYGDSSLNQIIETKFDVVETPGQTSAQFDLEPVNGHKYWWCVRAKDEYNTTDPTDPTWFTYSDVPTRQDDYTAVPTEPENGAVVLTEQPILTALNIAASGQNYYSFEVALDSGFFTSIVTSNPVPEGEGGYTSWKLTEKLESGQTYFWRVRANGYAYSAVSSFTVNFQIYASPNPVRFRQGEYVTFHLPDETVDLLIQAVSGETVLVERGISGDWAWHGTNASGQNVAIGTYLWYVPGTPFKGKILVKP